MSNRWPAGIIRKNPVTPAGPLQNGAASGVWSLADAAYWTKQGLWPLAGNTLAVEDVFSTYLYTGTAADQTITNGINLSGQGGLVWTKPRASATLNDHILVDSARGDFQIQTNTTAANNGIASFNFASNGYTVPNNGRVNQSAITYASWTFREAPNFFDIVTYTGDGTNNRSIAHNLGIAPGMIIVKNTTSAQSWIVYHRSTGTGNFTILNSTGAVNVDANAFPTVSSTAFVPTANEAAFSLNTSGQTFVAYLYAHDAASTGFIQCGTYTGNGSATGPVVTLGWEPQWVMIKAASSGPFGGEGNWQMYDNMRGWADGGIDAILYANLSGAEDATNSGLIAPTATGFKLMANYTANQSGTNYIYMAIRRGPMRTPTLGTSVFAPILQSPQSGGTLRTVGFPADFILGTSRGGGINRLENTKLTGFANNSGASINTPGMFTNTTGAESNQYPLFYNVWNTTARDGDYLFMANNVNWFFRRAPSFFDVVCYTGDGVGGSGRTITHGLGVAPELVIVKNRSASTNWRVWTTSFGSSFNALLNANSAPNSNFYVWANTYLAVTNPTTQFGVYGDGTSNSTNTSSQNYVAYLFASCPGVSKVGSYTGNGSSQTINCAFTTGSRFVMIKRTDSTGDWLVWDSARGIVAGNDPYLALNDTNAEVTTNDSVDTDNTGFIVNQVAASNVNVNAATYIFLAIA